MRSYARRTSACQRDAAPLDDQHDDATLWIAAIEELADLAAEELIPASGWASSSPTYRRFA
jgi:hypothetical protein